MRDLVEGDPAGAGRSWLPWELAVSRALVVLATAWFALVVSWELFGPILAGHYASSASMGIIAENMSRWGIVAPVWSYTSEPPDPSLYYCHHPWGIFWTTAGFYEVFGRHDFVCRLPAALLSVATPGLIYALAREIYRPLAAGLAALAFVVLPISLSFAAFNALEVPVIAYGTLFLWAWVRAKRTGRRLWYGVMVAGATLAMSSDWPAFVLVFAVLAIEMVDFVRLRKAVDRRRASAWVVLVAVGTTVGVFYLVMFARYGKLGDLFGSYELRSHSDARGLFATLDARRHWIELMFTPIAIGIGKAGLVVILFRVWLLRSVDEAAPLCVLAMALLQYLAFPQGADIHIFWPHHFALYFALAVAATTATLVPSIARRWPGGGGGGVLAVLAVVGLPLLVVARDGVEALVWARRTGGRFNEKGAFIESDGDKIAALRLVASDLPPDARIAMHESMRTNWAQVWALGGRVVTPTRFIPADGVPGHAVWIADLRRLRDGEAARLLHSFEVRAYGPYLVGLRPAEAGTLSAWSFHAAPPTFAQAWLRSGTEPVWSLAPDPFATWEIASHYGIDAPLPTAEPRTLEQLRVAHNIAVHRGDSDAADALRMQLMASFVGPHASFDHGLELLGVRVDEGVKPTFTLLFRAAGPLFEGVVPKVRSRVAVRATLSTVVPDPHRRDVAAPPLLAPHRWLDGYLYSVSAPLLPRPGVESFELTFAGFAAPRLTSGAPAVELFRY